MTRAAAGGLLGGLALWLLMSGRWGSYIGAPPVYLTDVVIALAATMLVGSVSRQPRPSVRLSATVLLCSTLALWAILRLVWSPALTETALRDFAPYLYAALSALVFLAGENRLWRAQPLVLGILALHPTWLAAVTWFELDVSSLPRLGGVPALTPRPDFDSAVCGVVFLVFVTYAFQVRRPVQTGFALGVAGVALVLVFTMPTRAGLLATGAAFTVWLCAHAPAAWRRARSERPKAQVALLVVTLTGVGIVAFLVPRTTAGHRFIEAASGNGEAFGTSHARALVWSRLAEYLMQEPDRWLTGVGFGPNFLRASGTLEFLQGDRYTGVRSPHMFLIGTWARLGLPGVMLTAAITVLGIVLAFRAVQRGTAPALTITAAMSAVAIPVVASFGVVLESPFGAIPYFWSLGHLAAWHHRHATRDVAVPAPSAGAVAEEST